MLSYKRLILKIKEESTKGRSDSSITREYGIDRITLAKYINVIDIEQTSIYNGSNRNYSCLDSYRKDILQLYSQTKNIWGIYTKFKSEEVNLIYSSLKYYIAKIKNNNMVKEYNESNNKVSVKISRSEIIKHIFNWKCKEDINAWIDRDMYGRAGYELLRKKVIYQSLFS